MKKTAVPLLLLFFVPLFAQTKIASLSPNLTEMVFLLGEEKQLAGRSSSCDYPADAKKIKVVGSFGKAFIEPLIASGARVVITSTARNKSDEKLLNKAGIRYLVVPDKNLEHYYSALRTLGNLLNCRDRAEKEIAKAKTALENIRKKTDAIPLEKRPKVLVMISRTPVITAGKRSFINDMITLAGGRNIAGKEEKDYFTCSPEWLLLHQPDIIILCRMGDQKSSDLKHDALFSQMKAVRQNRVLKELDPSLLYRLGPRSIEGIRLMNQSFYPPEQPGGASAVP